jgi:hypothetical protein
MGCEWPETALLILLSVVSVPVLMALGVLTFMLWNMLRGKGGWPG